MASMSGDDNKISGELELEPLNGQEEESGEGSDEGKSLFDPGSFKAIVEDRDTFRVPGKKTRHFVAHKEYGVVFSLCGIRMKIHSLQYNPPATQDETVCGKCKLHLKTKEFDERKG